MGIILAPVTNGYEIPVLLDSVDSCLEVCSVILEAVTLDVKLLSDNAFALRSDFSFSFFSQ